MRTAVIVGAGLIGTSVGLALTARGVSTYLLDHEARNARTAAALGAGTPGRPPGRADIAVLAVPPSQVAATLAEQQALGLAEAYTDVASVKELPYAQAARLGCDTRSFVGGHPFAGRERSGPLAARADLFQERPWVLTPGPETSEAALNHALELVSLCGGVPALLDVAAHDRAVALVSHLPHLMASLTAARLLDGEEFAVRLAGSGAKDVTRTAAGDARLWADIFGANAAELGKVLALLAGDLNDVARALEGLRDDDPVRSKSASDELTDVLRRGGAGRARIASSQGAAGSAALSVALTDEHWEMERLLEDVHRTRVDLEDMVLPGTSDQPATAVRLVVVPEQARPLSEALRDRGWTVSHASIA